MTSNPYESPSADGVRGSCVSDSVVEFDYTLEDTLNFSLRENQPHIRSAINQRRVLLVAASVIFAVVAISMFLSASSPNFLLVSALPTALMSVYFMIRALLAANQVTKAATKALSEMLSKRPTHAMVGRQRVTLSPDGIETIYPGGDTRWRWWAVSEIVVEPANLYIYVTSTEARVIPNRAFASDDHYQSFSSNARRLWEEFRETSP